MLGLLLVAALGQATNLDRGAASYAPATFAGTLELSAVQVGHGYLQGAMVCAHLRCGEPARGLVPFLGAGLLGGASLYVGWPALRPGTAMTVNWATAFGAYQGLVGPGALANRSPIPLAISAGAGIGAALGIILSQALQPEPGQVALTAAGAYWTVAATLLLNAAWNNRGLVPSAMLLPALGATVFGGLAAYVVPDVGRLHVLVMDGSAFLFSQLALLVCRAFNPDPASYDRVFRQFMVGGGLVGLAGAWVVGRRIEALRAPAFQLSVAPLVSREHAGAALSGAF